ncbi:MAG TPA: glycosyltransferase [Alphaproteobacteria bacterium]|nr:glycosyltransferase [Alphaproteobacteria bacterium]
MKILFVTRTLSGGGGERQLWSLATGLARLGVSVVIARFYESTSDPPALSGLRLVGGAKRGRWDFARFLAGNIALLRRERPDIVHGYLPAANCIAASLKPFLPGVKVVFGLRASDVDLARYDALSRAAYRVERWLAGAADMIICNSEAGRVHALALGYPARLMVVIDNGFDTERFRFDEAARRSVRAEWGVRDDEFLIGIVGRLDPMKDHANFLDAFNRVAELRDNARAVVVGDGPRRLRDELYGRAERLGVLSRVVWSPGRTDVEGVYSALDCLCLASAYGEGMPNVIGEAMACGTPVAATDVGDAARLVGGLGEIVPPRDSAALAAAIIRLMNLDDRARAERITAARRRIVDEFSVTRMVDRTFAALDALARTG